LIAFALALATANAQTDSAQSPAPPNPPAPTLGSPPGDNPPITGMDHPVWEFPLPSRSFLLPGLHVSESLDTNIGDEPGVDSTGAVTRVMGSLLFQKVNNRSMTALDYIGGAAFYTAAGSSISQVQQVDGEERLLWKKGDLNIRDQFSYLPEGSFGFGAYGESGAYDLGTSGIGYIGGGIGTGLGGIFGPGEFGTLGQQPRITNLTVVGVDQDLTARSSITMAGGYGLVHFTDNTTGFIDSNQIGAQAGYDYQLSPRNQAAILYGYQDFHYPNFASSTFTTHLVNVLFGRRISGRMELTLGAGPQYSIINNPLLGGTTTKLTVSAQASLVYRFPKTTLGVYYNRFNTSGSGYFVGATSDIVRLSLTRPITRVWTFGSDIGYSHNERIQAELFGLLPPATNSFQYVYAGAVLRRPLGKHFGFFVSYQFDYLSFHTQVCTGGFPCNEPSQRHMASIGLDWHPRPIPLD
jgi:hypothetical protein